MAWHPLLLTGLMLGSTGLAATPDPGAKSPDPVDPTIVLQAGPIAVSAYAWKKNETRFIQRFQQSRGRAPDAGELSEWRALFQAQQVLLADAQARGYFERPEIRAALAQMERHMLTQTDGPFYTGLCAAGGPGEKRLEELHELNRRVLAVEYLWFDSAGTAQAALGRDFSTADSAEKLRRLQAAQTNPHARYFTGSMTWPCEPFPAAAERILSLEPGQWLEPDPVMGETLQLLVREVRIQEIPAFADVRDRFAAFAREVEKRRLRQQRHAEILRLAQWNLEADTVAAIAARVGATADATGKISAPAPAGFSTRPLARYTWESQPVTIDVAAWQRWFNDQLARRVPRDAWDVGESLANLVVERFDLHAARAAGVDAEPRFAEDRRNFLRQLVLDAYEREELSPVIKITEAAVQSFYATHAARYERVVRVRARRLEFPDARSAMNYLDPAHAADRAAPERDAEITVGLAPGLEWNADLAQRLVASSTGSAIVLPTLVAGGRTVILVRGTDLEKAPLPLDEVRGGIRWELERTALDQQTLARARTLAPGGPLLPLQAQRLSP